MKITRDLLRLWGACYDDARIDELVPEAGLTPLEIALDNVPVEDRLWVLLREELIPARDLRLLACGWAEAACKAAGWNDERSLAAIAVGWRHAVGEATEDELAAAWTEAWLSARSARSARSSVRSLWAAALSARSVAEAPAREAAWWSAKSSALSMALAEADRVAALVEEAAAEVSAWAEQLADVVRVLRKIEGGTQE